MKLEMKGSEDNFQNNPDLGNNAVSEDNILLRPIPETWGHELEKELLLNIPHTIVNPRIMNCQLMRNLNYTRGRSTD